MQPRAVLLKHAEETAGRVGGLVGGLFDALQEKIQPLLPCAMSADTLQQLVVGGAVALEIEAEVE